MLGTLREYSGSWVMKTILGLLALSFVVGFGMLTGGGVSNIQQNAIVAYVNGEPITNRDLTVAYNQLYERYRQEMGDQLTEDVLEQLNLRFQALNMLVTRQVLIDEARRMGLVVSNPELQRNIAQIAAFQGPDGSFDPERYRQVLAQNRELGSPSDFEERQRRQLLIGKLERFVKSSVHVSDEEVLQEYLLDNSEVNLELLRFNPSQMARQMDLSDAELRTYYRNHPEQFESGPQATARIIQLPLERWMEQVELPEAELRAAYEANTDRWKAEEQVRARHILIKVAEDATEAKVASARQRTEELMARIEAGEDFEELARGHSQDPGSAGRGGSLGMFGRGRMVPPFEEAAFATPAGELTGPVRTRFGFHIIQVQEKQDAGVRSFEEVREELAAAERKARAADLASEDAREVLTALQGGATVTEATAGMEVEVDTATIGSNDRQAQLQYPQPLLNQIFATEDPIGPEGRVVVANDQTYIVQVLNRAESGVFPFPEVRDQIRRKLAEEKALTMAAEQSAGALERLKRGESMDRVARRYGVDVEQTGPFNMRSEEVPLVGKHEQMFQTAFSLSEQNPLPRSTFKGDKAYYVIKLLNRREPTPEEFRAALDRRKLELLNDKQEAVWSEWVQTIKSEATIRQENPPSDILGSAPPTS